MIWGLAGVIAVWTIVSFGLGMLVGAIVRLRNIREAPQQPAEDPRATRTGERQGDGARVD